MLLWNIEGYWKLIDLPLWWWWLSKNHCKKKLKKWKKNSWIKTRSSMFRRLLKQSSRCQKEKEKEKTYCILIQWWHASSKLVKKNHESNKLKMFGKLNFFFIVFKYLKIDFQNFQNLKKFKRFFDQKNWPKIMPIFFPFK